MSINKVGGRGQQPTWEGFVLKNNHNQIMMFW
jgi:hypothetical protein